MAEKGQTQLAGFKRRADDEDDEDDETLGNEKATAGSKSLKFEASEVKDSRITGMAADQRRTMEEGPSEQSQGQHPSKQSLLRQRFQRRPERRRNAAVGTGGAACHFVSHRGGGGKKKGF